MSKKIKQQPLTLNQAINALNGRKDVKFPNGLIQRLSKIIIEQGKEIRYIVNNHYNEFEYKVLYPVDGVVYE